MKLLITIVLAELAWLFFAASGPVWAFVVGFVGFTLTPALAILYHERSRELAQRVEYSDVVGEVSRG